MFGFIIVIDKIVGVVIELDRMGVIVDGFGWFIYFKFFKRVLDLLVF